MLTLHPSSFLARGLQVSLQKGATHSEPVVEGPLGGEDIQVQRADAGCLFVESGDFKITYSSKICSFETSH